MFVHAVIFKLKKETGTTSANLKMKILLQDVFMKINKRKRI